jgi:DNA-binding GntR family transcriptional regulator
MYAFDVRGSRITILVRRVPPDAEARSVSGLNSTGNLALVARRAQLHIVSVVDRVYDVLHGRIIRGELKVGSRIHQENVSEELGVSRTPVREALARLAAEGLVELLPNRGARVADVTIEDMRISYEARLAVEPLAARYAAERRNPSDIKRIEGALAEQRRARTTRATYQAIRRFHLAVVEAAGNPLIARFAGSLWAGRIGLHVFLRQADRAVLDADLDEHRAIAHAIEHGESELAEQLMHAHIGMSLERLLAFQGDSQRSVAASAE